METDQWLGTIALTFSKNLSQKTFNLQPFLHVYVLKYEFFNKIGKKNINLCIFFLIF